MSHTSTFEEVKHWLETIKPGYEKFAPAFDEYGCEDMDDVKGMLEQDTLDSVLMDKLREHGAKPLHEKRIKEAISLLHNQGREADAPYQPQTETQSQAQAEEDDQVLYAQQVTADPLPYAAGHWQCAEPDEAGPQSPAQAQGEAQSQGQTEAQPQQAQETPQAPAQASSTNTPTDFKKLKNPELRAELKKRGLPSSGNKPELVKRLEESNDRPCAPKSVLDAIAKKSDKLSSTTYAKVKKDIDEHKDELEKLTIEGQKVAHALMIADKNDGWVTMSHIYGLYVQYPELKDNFNEYKDEVSFRASCREALRGHITYGSERHSKHLGKVQPGAGLKHQRNTEPKSSDKLHFFAPIEGVYKCVNGNTKMDELLNEVGEWRRQQA